MVAVLLGTVSDGGRELVGFPYLPRRDFQITFRESPVKSYVDGKQDKLTIHAVVKKNGLELGPRHWRTSSRFLWHEFDRIFIELGSLFNVTLRVTSELYPVEIVNNPNRPLFNMASLLGRR